VKALLRNAICTNLVIPRGCDLISLCFRRVQRDGLKIAQDDSPRESDERRVVP
jgi:hypothetical protein